MIRDPYANDLTLYEQMIREREMTEEIARQREEAKREAWARSEPHRQISEQWFREWMKHNDSTRTPIPQTAQTNSNT